MRQLLSKIAVPFFAIGLISTSAVLVPASANNAARADYIVVFNERSLPAQAEQVIAQQRINPKFRYNSVFVGFAASLTSSQATALQNNPNITIVEPDAEVRLDSTTQSGATWGLDRIDQASLPLNSQYTYSQTGSGVRSYIVDTGIRPTHNEYASRVLTGYSSIADGNGTVDCNGHGTHVAGTVLGTVFGVAKGSSVVPVRVLDCGGSGSWSGVIAGLDWIRNNHPSGTPGVANMSLGGGANSSVDLAVRNLVNSGVTVVVAAGNSKRNACNYSPAREPLAITVAASTNTDTLASFSNFGSCVDIIAPGLSITSAWYTGDNAAATISGTSMASPHVAGAAALLLQGGNQTPTAIVNALINNSTKNQITLTSTQATTPNKLLFTNVAAVATATISYNANGGTGSIASTTTAVGNSVTLPSSGVTRAGYTLTRWTTQADGGGSTYALGQTINMPAGGLNLFAQWTANTYQVTFDAQGGATPSAISYQSGNSIMLPATVYSGYTFNGWFTSPTGGTTVGSNGDTYTPASPFGNVTLFAQWTADGITPPPSTDTAPSQVATPTLSQTGKRSLSASWSVPTSTGGKALTGYLVRVYKNGSLSGTISVNADQTSVSFDASPGRYRVDVIAINEIGSSTPSGLSNEIRIK